MGALLDWRPSPAGPGPGLPRYRAIAEALARDVEGGRLAAGARLPPQRALARELGVTVATIGRAYADAEARGLVRSEAGRGTFVLAEPARVGEFSASGELAASGERAASAGAAGAPIDLRRSFPPPLDGPAYRDVLREARGALDGAGAAGLLERYETEPTAAQRRAGARWLALAGLDAPPERVRFTAGAQHALMVALLAVRPRGRVVVTERLANPGLRAAAEALRIDLAGVATDAYGIVPASLERALRGGSVAALCCSPTVQNPTAALMPEGRRDELAALLDAHDVALIEDDPLGPLAGGRPRPLAARRPAASLHIVSASMALLPGLRLAVVAAGEELCDEVDAALRATLWTPSPLLAEQFARLVREGGVAQRVAAARAAEARARTALALAALEGADVRAQPFGFHAWLALPAPWTSDGFAAAAGAAGVAVAPASSFAVGPPGGAGVRLGLGTPRTREALRAGLERLAGVLASR